MSNEKKQPECRSDDEVEHTMAGTRVVLQKCILIPFRRLDETWPCLVSWGVVQTGCITAKPCSCVQPSGKGRKTIIDFWSGNMYYLTISPAHASGVALRLEIGSILLQILRLYSVCSHQDIFFVSVGSALVCVIICHNRSSRLSLLRAEERALYYESFDF